MIQEVITQQSFTGIQWAIAIAAAIILGISKAGINAISFLTVTLLASVFGSKVSTGILLPMLIFADILAVLFYKRGMQWLHLYRLLPWMSVGVLIGAWAGRDLNESIFRIFMAGIILVSIAPLLWFEKQGQLKIPSSRWFSRCIGLGAGFTTMVGNLAGGLSNIYFMSMRLPKSHFIGTSAFLFMIINVFKLPFHIFSWETITQDSLLINILLLPFMLIGFFVGVLIVRRIEEAHYRTFILWLTAIGAAILAIETF